MRGAHDDARPCRRVACDSRTFGNQINILYEHSQSMSPLRRCAALHDAALHIPLGRLEPPFFLRNQPIFRFRFPSQSWRCSSTAAPEIVSPQAHVTRGN